METPRVNILLMGASVVTCKIVGMLLQTRREPIAIWETGEALLLPSAGGCATMVLKQVGTLSSENQLQVLQWLEQPANRTQVISTTSESLLPLVHAGAFNETLLYRLNTICLDVNI